MVIYKNAVADVKCAKKQTFSIVFLRALFPVSSSRSGEVGRVVSLNIDLQDISELDRDVVIALCRRREKNRQLQSCIT